MFTFEKELSRGQHTLLAEMRYCGGIFASNGVEIHTSYSSLAIVKCYAMTFRVRRMRRSVRMRVLMVELWGFVGRVS